jgi:hypothetical protein
MTVESLTALRIGSTGVRTVSIGGRIDVTAART